MRMGSPTQLTPVGPLLPQTLIRTDNQREGWLMPDKVGTTSTMCPGRLPMTNGWRCSMPVRLSLTLVILIVCTTWYARAQSVPQMTKVVVLNSFAGDVSVWSVDPTSKQETLIGNAPGGCPRFC
jgi:hypothetical protein